MFCAAITCGMPLPCAPGNTCRVSSDDAAMPAGQIRNASHGRAACTCSNTPSARLASAAKPMATAATTTAPTQNTKRRSQCRGDISGRRRSRRIWRNCAALTGRLAISRSIVRRTRCLAEATAAGTTGFGLLT